MLLGNQKAGALLQICGITEGGKLFFPMSNNLLDHFGGHVRETHHR